MARVRRRSDAPDPTHGGPGPARGGVAARARRRARDHPRAPAAHLRVGRAAPVRRDPRRGGAARGRPPRCRPWWPPATARASRGSRAAPGRASPAERVPGGRRRAHLAHADAQRARGGPAEPARGGRARRDQRGGVAGGGAHALLPARPLQPDRLHDRRQRRRELGRRPLLQVRLHHQLRDRPGAGAPRRLARAARRQGARPAGARPDRRVRGLRGHARRGHEDLAARGARAGGGAHARGVLRLDHAGRRGGVEDRVRRDRAGRGGDDGQPLDPRGRGLHRRRLARRTPARRWWWSWTARRPSARRASSRWCRCARRPAPTRSAWPRTTPSAP